MKLTISLISGLILSMPVLGAPIPIAGYDINDAIISGHGNWDHSYSGTITPGDSFANAGWPGTKATYSGVGSGTLNNGIVETSHDATQLFIEGTATDGTPFATAIFSTLSFAYTIDTIEVYGGDFGGNFIPGVLTGMLVTLFGPSGTFSEFFTTTPFGFPAVSGPASDRISLVGSSLEGVPAFTVILSEFEGTYANWFSIAEIKLDGARAPDSAVPEPSTFGLVGAAGLALGLLRRR